MVVQWLSVDLSSSAGFVLHGVALPVDPSRLGAANVPVPLSFLRTDSGNDKPLRIPEDDNELDIIFLSWPG